MKVNENNIKLCDTVVKREILEQKALGKYK